VEIFYAQRFLNNRGFRAPEACRLQRFSSCGGCRGAEVWCGGFRGAEVSELRRFLRNGGFRETKVFKTRRVSSRRGFHAAEGDMAQRFHGRGRFHGSEVRAPRRLTGAYLMTYPSTSPTSG